MYDPTIGRWLNPDPTGFTAGDENLYRFVGNDPTDYVDPSGLQEKKPKEVDPGGTKVDLPKSNNLLRIVSTPDSKAKLLKDIEFGRKDGWLCPLDKTSVKPYVVSGDRGWAGVLSDGVLIGPDGCGPCVGIVLLPPVGKEKEMKTYILHLSAGADVSESFKTVGFMQKEVVKVEKDFGGGSYTYTFYSPLKDYRAYICGACKPAAGVNFKEDDETRLHTLEDVVLFCKRQKIDIKCYIPAPGFAVSNGGLFWSSDPAIGDKDGYEK